MLRTETSLVVVGALFAARRAHRSQLGAPIGRSSARSVLGALGAPATTNASSPSA